MKREKEEEGGKKMEQTKGDPSELYSVFSESPWQRGVLTMARIIWMCGHNQHIHLQT